MHTSLSREVSFVCVLYSVVCVCVCVCVCVEGEGAEFLCNRSTPCSIAQLYLWYRPMQWQRGWIYTLV